MFMNHGELADSVRMSYRSAAAKYRCDDEIEITTERHERLKHVLETISASFGRPITVLDAGCGTGRYFHCLKNVEKLVGLDVSEEMLQIAERPVRQEEVTARQIVLQCENIHLASFPSGSFDLIYSLGMFGNGCPVTVEICNKFHDWLAPGGQLFFDTVDLKTMPFLRRIRRAIRNGLQPFLPEPLRNAMSRRNAGVPFFGLNRRDVQNILRASQFKSFSTASHACNSPLWQVSHIECLASKARVSTKVHTH
jgi:SAM-dependent methyltransferase